MAKFIQKFENQSAYDAAEHQYPNTSLVGNDIVFQMTEPTPPAFGGLTVKYNIVDPTQEVTLFSGGGASSSSSSSSSSSESGGGGTLPTTMIVDGVSETPINTWRFETTGEHTVQYEFADNIIPAGFLTDSVATATEAIIGDDITEITGSSANVDGAFQNSVITTVTIGTGITTIGDSAFAASYLETLTVKAETPPTLGSNALADSITAIYVPASVVDGYKNSTSTGWYEYASIIQAIQ